MMCEKGGKENARTHSSETQARGEGVQTESSGHKAQAHTAQKKESTKRLSQSGGTMEKEKRKEIEGPRKREAWEQEAKRQ